MSGGRSREFQKVMDESGDPDGFPSAPEVRLDPLILPIRVKLADEKPAAGHQSPRRLRKYEIQVFDVLQDEIAGDEIEGTRLEGP